MGFWQNGEKFVKVSLLFGDLPLFLQFHDFFTISKNLSKPKVGKIPTIRENLVKF